ncbi:ABC transporter ATP-binding protein [Desulfothermobacter acidiphilus]|uniref:ABC transporter ATP-binding protein n=1 Tax=Desulfothermobacter acidiphilus TaxID=1938353 RepID=UPI003F89C245
MACIVTKDLIVGYGDSVIIEGISVQVDGGQLVAVVGPNGSGKSTLLKGIIGLARQFGGQVYFKDREITHLPPYLLTRLGIGYVPQVNNIYGPLTVRENLLLGAYFRRDRAETAKDLNEVLSVFPELARKQKSRAQTLSGGERQLLAIGRALMGRPRVLLLDEPLAFLAPKTALLILEKLREIKERGLAILLVEQNTFLALENADYAYVLNQGRCVAEGKGKELLQDASLQERFLGLPKGVRTQAPEM